MDQEMLTAILLIIELAVLLLALVIWNQVREVSRKSDVDNIRISSVEDRFKIFRKDVEDYKKQHEQFELDQMEQIKNFIDRHDEQIEALIKRHLK